MCWQERLRPARDRIRAIFFDDGGRMWVERKAGDGWAFDIFDREGRLQAEMEAPDRWPRILPFVRGERLYTVWRDSLQILYVKAYAIESRGG